MNTQKQITIFGLIAIVSIIASPFVYAAVEPHIIIKMDVGQTTNPFTIQDSTGTDVFAIAPDGSGAGYSEGTEVMLYDGSGFTGTSGAFTYQAALIEFTMPSASNYYVITAIEVRTGTTASVANQVCGAVYRPNNGITPLADNDWLSSNMVALARNNATAGGGGYDTATSTIYKMNAVSGIVNGGETLLVVHDTCHGGSATQFDGATRTLTVSETGQSEFDKESGIGDRGEMQAQATTNNYYVVVYGKPLA